MPDRSNSMYNIPGFKISARGYHRFARRQTPNSGDNFPAFVQDSRAASPVNSTIHTTPSHQTGIGSINNSVCFLPRNVSLNQAQPCLTHSYVIDSAHSHLTTDFKIGRAHV